MMMYDEESNRPEYTSKSTGYTPVGAVGEAVFRIRVFDNAEIKGKVSVTTTRAGVLPVREFIVRQ